MISRKVILFTILILSTILNAESMHIPSKAQIKKSIKKIKYPSLGIVGLDTYRHCDKVTIKKVRILKIYGAAKEYIERTGEYVGSNFKVKIKATGTCTFSKFHSFNQDIDGDGNKDYIAGTLPIINEVLEATFNGYGNDDWHAASLYTTVNLNKKRIKNHIKKIFLKAKRATGDKYLSRVIVNNIQKGKGNGKYRGKFALSNKRFVSEHKYISETVVTRAFGAKYRPADWKDLINYSQTKGKVASLFHKLGIGKHEGVLISLNGDRFGEHVAVYCRSFDRKKYFLGKRSKKLKSEDICLAYTYARPKNRFLAFSKE